MTRIAETCFRGTVASMIGVVVGAPLGGAMGAACGFIYAKFADLPVGQATQAWAVWYAAECAIGAFAGAFIDNKKTLHLTVATILTVSGAIGIQELQKRGLIGEKMTIAMIVLRAWGIFNELKAAF